MPQPHRPPHSPHKRTCFPDMSASQIPNLNTLRRGGGRGRFRGRGGADGSLSGGGHGPRGTTSKDRVVQGTDNDASVSRLSAVALGYLHDPFAKTVLGSGFETRRLPIINRGTYVRTTAIDHLVTQFLSQEPQTKKQIISLGAGTDTRAFRLFASQSPPNLIYHEIDFAVNTAAKIKFIRSTPLLQRALGIGRPEDATISDAGDALHTDAYHLHPLDLRCLKRVPVTDASQADSRVHLRGLDTTLPTLLISECCLVYLSPSEAADVVGYFTETLFPGTGDKSNAGSAGDTERTESATPLGLILYEPIRPDDAFGRTMVSNLATRGIHLQTLHQYASLAAQRKRLREQGFREGQAAADVDFIWERWVSEEEKERVSGLEMLDEMEEWRLLAQHYCIAWGWREGSVGVFDGWRGIEGQSAD
ncbi:Leucine carboxyl methyltransferase superfamily [Aspergillus flavus AF70]|nr:Leucine carboxyl methyltransferase superfamily [Aspergillus flavus AF70]